MVKRKGVDPRSRDPKPHSKHEGLGKRGNPYGLEQNPLDDPTGAKYDNKNVRNVVQHPVDDPTGAGYDNKNPYALKQHPVNDPYGVKYDNKNVRNVEQHPDDDPYGTDYSNKDPFASTSGTDFPHIRFRGNWEAGQELVRQAKKEMMLTASLAYKMGAPEYGRTILVDAEVGSYIHTQINGGIHSIEIVVPAIPPEEEVEVSEDEEIVEEPEILIYVGIYSGFAYSYNIQWELSDGPPPLPLDWRYRLHEFNPTEPCREAYPDDFDPGLEYQPITRLVMEPDPDIRTFGGSSYHRDGFRPSWMVTNEGGDVEQSNLVHPCAYTGPMARAVSLALGNGHFNLLNPDDRELLLDDHAHPWWTSVVRSYGFRIAYDWHYDRTHGALQDNVGDWWLVEIAQYHGIIARRMPMIKYSFLPEDPEEQEAVKEFGGIPSGESFPNSNFEIAAQIAEGNIIRLMETDDYQTDFMDDQLFYSQACGWCFNDDGTEARVTTYNYEHVNGWMQSAYWKLELSISIKYSGPQGTATLTKIREDILADGRELRLNGTNISSSFSHFPIFHYRPEANNIYNFNMATQPFTDHWDDIDDGGIVGGIAFDFPIWVGWIDDNWHEINYRMCKIVEWQKGVTTSRLWPASEAGPNKPGIDHTGRMPSAPGSTSDFSDPEWVLVSSYSPAYNLGTPIVDNGMTNNGTFVDINTIEPEWLNVTTHGYIGDERVTDIYQIFEVRQIYTHTETWNPPDQSVDFMMVPYNRNAYFIRNYYQRPAKKEQHVMHRLVFMYQNIYGARHNDGETLYSTGDPAPGWDSFDPGIEYNYVPGIGAPGTGLLQYQALQSADTTPPGCTVPPTAPPPKWYIDRASAKKQGGGNGSWGPAEDNFPAYGSADQSWHPSPPCDIPKPTGVANYRTDLWPRQGGGARADGIHDVSTEEETQELWLVADRTPVATGDAPFSIGVVDYADDYTIDPTDNLYICQAAVVGKKGFIYSDVSQITYDVPSGSPYFFVPMLHEGIMPEVKEGGFLNYERRWLTFVGVNNP